LLRRLHTVRKPGVVAEIDVVLLRQRDQALVQDSEPADAGVEDADRQGRVWSVGVHALR
jgi:hypothetical protein